MGLRTPPKHSHSVFLAGGPERSLLLRAMLKELKCNFPVGTEVQEKQNPSLSASAAARAGEQSAGETSLSAELPLQGGFSKVLIHGWCGVSCWRLSVHAAWVQRGLPPATSTVLWHGGLGSKHNLVATPLALAAQHNYLFADGHTCKAVACLGLKRQPFALRPLPCGCQLSSAGPAAGRGHALRPPQQLPYREDAPLHSEEGPPDAEGLNTSWKIKQRCRLLLAWI